MTQVARRGATLLVALAVALAALMACALPVGAQPALAAEPLAAADVFATEGGVAAQGDTVTVVSYGYGSASDLGISITFPASIACGQPTTFTLAGVNGTGNYKYRIYSLSEGDGVTAVYDESHYGNSNYSTDNTWSFTFYASGTYYIRFSVMDLGAGKYMSSGMYDCKLVVDDAGYPSVDQIVASVAKECLAQCSTDYDKALWLHDWLVYHSSYDYSYSRCSAEGVLAAGTGTCESYHRAYEKLLAAVGLESGRIEGTKSSLHVWTAVKIDGQWCQVDTTWDEDEAQTPYPAYAAAGDLQLTADDLCHLYFGVDDAIISLVHTDHTPQAAYASNTLDNDYFIRNGRAADFAAGTVDLAAIQSQLDAGVESFTLTAKNASWVANYKNVVDNVAAWWLSGRNWATSQGASVQLDVAYADDVYTFQATYTKDWLKGDVNNNGELNIVDAQLAFDYARLWSDDADMGKRADVTGTDGVVDATDARAIMYATHYGWA